MTYKEGLKPLDRNARIEELLSRPTTTGDQLTDCVIEALIEDTSRLQTLVVEGLLQSRSSRQPFKGLSSDHAMPYFDLEPIFSLPIPETEDGHFRNTSGWIVRVEQGFDIVMPVDRKLTIYATEFNDSGKTVYRELRYAFIDPIRSVHVFPGGINCLFEYGRWGRRFIRPEIANPDLDKYLESRVIIQDALAQFNGSPV